MQQPGQQQFAQLHDVQDAPFATDFSTLPRTPQEDSSRPEEPCTTDQQHWPKVGRPPTPSAPTQLHPAPSPHSVDGYTDPHPTSAKVVVATTSPTPGVPAQPAPGPGSWSWPWRLSRCCSLDCCTPSRAASWPALGAFVLLSWSSLGVIFGDIATSPLYVFTTVFAELGTQQPSKVRRGPPPSITTAGWLFLLPGFPDILTMSALSTRHMVPAAVYVKLACRTAA